MTRICDEEILSTSATVAHCYVHIVEEHESNKTGDNKMKNFERFGFIGRMRSNEDGQLVLPHSESDATDEYEEHEAYPISLRPNLKLEGGPIAYPEQSTLCACPKCGSVSLYEHTMASLGLTRVILCRILVSGHGRRRSRAVPRAAW